MTDEKINEQFQALKGELLATQIAIRALILANPDPGISMAGVVEELERWTAGALPRPVSEAFLSGMDRARNRLLPSSSDLARFRKKPPPDHPRDT